MKPYTGKQDFTEFFAYLNAQAGEQKYRPAAGVS